MIVTIASYKGGVGKTTTALHLAAFFQRLAPTLLVDGDAIRTSIKWSQRGNGTGLLFTQNRHPMATTPVKSACKAVIATSLRR